ncbi:MAG: hypothetical protein NC238_07725, partial [Dehalobacter sp.]|nr:hypothetical protein [Dehalobacter sp.]
MALFHRTTGEKSTNRLEKSVISPIALGSATGISVACFFLMGGYDAYEVFFTNEIQTVPAWVHLITVPIGRVPWPTSWVLLSFITLLSAIWAKNQLSGRWWLMVFSVPMLWELWSGQIEWLPVLGA